MPFLELQPINTTVVAAGWSDPTNAYLYNNSFAYSETNNAEQSYDYANFFRGNQVIDKVFVKLEFIVKQTTVLTGDNATCTFSIKVYDGSSWTTYQVTKYVYACTTGNAESFTCTDGDNSNSTVAIDVTSKLNTIAKLNSAQTRLLTAITVDAGVTMRVSVDCISILVCYHIEGGAYPTAKAVTRKDLDRKEYRAVESVSKYLKAVS